MIELLAQTATDPEIAKAWSDAILYMFDQWWERVLLIMSVLTNFGLLTKKGQELANKTLRPRKYAK